VAQPAVSLLIYEMYRYGRAYFRLSPTRSHGEVNSPAR
jgi:hypothetical protein